MTGSATLSFLSTPWLDAARQLFEGHRAPLLEGEHRIGYVHGTAAHTQTWHDGSLAGWSEGIDTDCTLTVCCDRDALRSWLGDEPARDGRLEVRQGGTRVCSFPLAPEDLAPSVSRRRINGLDFQALVRFPDHPLGPASSSYVWTEGLLQPAGTQAASPDVIVSLPFPEGIEYLLGVTPFRQMAFASTVESTVAFALGCLTGLLAPAGGTRMPTERLELIVVAAGVLGMFHRTKAALAPLLARTIDPA